MSIEWIAAEWPAPSGIVAGTTLRKGGASAGAYASLNLAAHVGDAENAVRENRRRFTAACRLPAEPRWLAQVHGTTVAEAETCGTLPEADAIVAATPGAVCAVLTADCLPVLFTSEDGAEIGAAHAGWRGLGNGILEATLSRLATPPSHLMAWFGPAISQGAFEVGDEVRAFFLERDPEAAAGFTPNDRGRWHADLYFLAALRLRRAGLTRIYGGGRCTFGEPEAFFSYRRDGGCGRMATFVFRSAISA